MTASLGRRRSNISCSSHRKPGGRSRHERRGAGRTVEFAGFAFLLDRLAIRLPVLAILGADGTSRVIALLVLVPAVFGGSPASLLVRVARERQATPVVILHDAVGRLQAEGLLALCCPGFNVPLGGTALISWWAESGKVKLLGSVPDAKSHGGILHANMAWDGDGVFGYSRAGRVEEDLSTSDIELWVRGVLVSIMQSEQFGADEVVAACKVGGKLDGEFAVIGHDFRSTKLRGRVIVVVFEDLEPSGSGRVVVGSRVVDLLHVDGAGTHVALVQRARLRSVRPVAEIHGHGRTGFGWAYASNALLAVDAAGHVGAGRGSDGGG